MAEPKKRPDARPMRLALAAGTVAALSAATAGLVRFGTGDAASSPASPPAQQPASNSDAMVPVRHVVRYVNLKPGQTAPPGAKVITAKAPAPRVVVSRVAGPVRNPPPPKRIVVTRQSGRP